MQRAGCHLQCHKVIDSMSVFGPAIAAAATELLTPLQGMGVSYPHSKSCERNRGCVPVLLPLQVHVKRNVVDLWANKPVRTDCDTSRPEGADISVPSSTGGAPILGVCVRQIKRRILGTRECSEFYHWALDMVLLVVMRVCVCAYDTCTRIWRAFVCVQTFVCTYRVWSGSCICF